MRATTPLLLALAIASLTLGAGCVAVERLSDEDLAKVVQTGAEKASEYGIKFALEREPSRSGAIISAAATAESLIRGSILPIFSTPSQDVWRSTVDSALLQFNEQLDPQIRAAIQLAINVLAAQVNLPANPTTKLDARTLGAVKAFFTGLATGLHAAVEAPITKALKPTPVWPRQ
jgi:hypothetical protein